MREIQRKKTQIHKSHAFQLLMLVRAANKRGGPAANERRARGRNSWLNQLSPLDILSGRGPTSSRNIGNRHFLRIINVYKASSKEMSVREKKVLVRQLYDCFISEGFRFLKVVSHDDCCVTLVNLPKLKACDKIRQALNYVAKHEKVQNATKGLHGMKSERKASVDSSISNATWPTPSLPASRASMPKHVPTTTAPTFDIHDLNVAMSDLLDLPLVHHLDSSGDAIEQFKSGTAV